MKILLTQPLIDSKHIAAPFRLPPKTNTFPYGLAMLAAVARQTNHKVCVFEPYFNQTTPEEYISYLKEEQFDVVGCTVYTLTFPLAKKLFEYTRQVLPNAFTVAGGAHPTSLPKQTLQEIPQVDCVVTREGELAFIDLLERIKTGDSFHSVKGIAYRRPTDGEIVVNPPREFIADLDELPLPAYDLFPMDEYITTPNIVRRYPTVATQVTRGCPFHCAFCEYNLALGKKYRHRSPEKIIEELVYLKERYKTRGIVFRDSTFTVDIPFLRSLCEQMIKNKLNLVWMCYSRTDVIAKYGTELLPLMRKAGCWQIGYGCESGNQKSLDLIHKEITVENNVDAVQATIKEGIMCSTTWILALPGETQDDAYNTVKLALRLASHIAKFFLPIPYPNTELEKLCRQDGGLRENAPYEDYELYTPTYPVYVNPRIGRENMRQMLKNAYYQFYTNPKVLYRNLLQLKDWDMVKKYWRTWRLLF